MPWNVCSIRASSPSISYVLIIHCLISSVTSIKLSFSSFLNQSLTFYYKSVSLRLCFLFYIRIILYASALLNISIYESTAFPTVLLVDGGEGCVTSVIEMRRDSSSYLLSSAMNLSFAHFHMNAFSILSYSSFVRGAYFYWSWQHSV